MVDLVRLGDYHNARHAFYLWTNRFPLDDELNRQLRQEILRLHSDLGFKLAYVTHSRDEAEAIGTRTVYISQGRVDQAFDASHAA